MAEQSEKSTPEQSGPGVGYHEPFDKETAGDAGVLEAGTASRAASSDVQFTVFTETQKLYIVFMASWAGFFSPVSSQIYYPALDSLAKSLDVSISLINLTLTSYMVRVPLTRHIQECVLLTGFFFVLMEN